MDKKSLTVFALIAGFLIFSGAGCGQSAVTGDADKEKAPSAQKTESTKSKKTTTSKTTPQLTEEVRLALAKVYGQAKLTSNQPNFLGQVGWTGLTFSVGRNASEADTSALNSALAESDYKLNQSESEDDPTSGRSTILHYFSSQYYLAVTFYANRPSVEIMIAPADEVRAVSNE